MAQEGSNYAEALKAERKRVVRGFQRYDVDARANHAASHRLGHQQRNAVGEDFFTHPDLPGVCYSTRIAAAHAETSELTPAA